jgi:hypothetical protein
VVEQPPAERRLRAAAGGRALATHLGVVSSRILVGLAAAIVVGIGGQRFLATTVTAHDGLPPGGMPPGGRVLARVSARGRVDLDVQRARLHPGDRVVVLAPPA